MTDIIIIETYQDTRILNWLLITNEGIIFYILLLTHLTIKLDKY